MTNLTRITGYKALSTIYLVTGLIFIFLFIQSALTLVHLSILGILSLAAFYGIYTKAKWAIYLTIPSSLLGITFAIVTLYLTPNLQNLPNEETITITAASLYIIALTLSILYLLIKRREQQET